MTVVVAVLCSHLSAGLGGVKPYVHSLSRSPSLWSSDAFTARLPPPLLSRANSPRLGFEPSDTNLRTPYAFHARLGVFIFNYIHWRKESKPLAGGHSR